MIIKTGWTAIRVGPSVLGAVGPSMPTKALSGSYQPVILVMMGDTEYRFNARDFQRSLKDEVDLEYRYLNKVDDEFNALMNMFSYRKQFAISVPVGSLDVTSSGEIDFTFRSGETLTAVLQNFFNALAVEVQADLHGRTPVEVVRKFAELIHLNYLPALRENLTWRGMLLDDVLKQETTMKVKVVRQPFLNASYDGFFGVQDLPSSYSYDGSLGGKGFGSFVDWQVRRAIAPTRVFPMNVIHVRAATLADYALAEEMFGDRRLLQQYFAKKSCDPMDASFFLSMAGDPLEGWLDGEAVDAKDFLDCKGTDNCRN